MRSNAFAIALFSLVLSACSPNQHAESSTSSISVSGFEAVKQKALPSFYAEIEKDSAHHERLPITVHKTPSCGCCSVWVDHLRRSNFEVSVVNHDDLTPIKQRLGVPPSLTSCHTAEIRGLFVEGHVPSQEIRRMLDAADYAASPIKGIAVPNMPVGSPGMEMGARLEPYQVILVDEEGHDVVFAEYGN